MFFMLSCSLLHAEEVAETTTMEATIEVRAAAFYHTSDKYRNYYKSLDPSYEVEFSFSCDPCCYAWWGNLAWFNSKKEVAGNNCKSHLTACSCTTFVTPTTKISVANFSFGIKFPYYFSDCLVGYFGVGPVIGNVWFENNSNRGTRRTSKVAYGAIAKLGIDYYITQCVFLDLFVDYLYETVHHGRHYDIGGVKTGLGIGLRF